MAPRTQTRQERVHAALRADILDGKVAPGARLAFAQLGDRYKASVGVIREALSRLVEQGLVTSEAQFGFRVASVSPTDLLHLTEARIGIETLTLRSAMRSGGLAWESSVVAAHHHMSGTPMLDDTSPPRLSENWSALHAQFHSSLLAGSPNTRLRNVADNLRDTTELYRRWSVTFAQPGHRDVALEHRGIVDAVLAQDEELACDLLATHIDRTTRALLSIFNSRTPRQASPILD